VPEIQASTHIPEALTALPAEHPVAVVTHALLENILPPGQVQARLIGSYNPLLHERQSVGPFPSQVQQVA
jgi:hypothetical protein